MKYDDVKCPIHYRGDGLIECKRAMRSMLSATPYWLNANTVYWWGAAFKYLWRWPLKNRIKDIDKAIECLNIMKQEAIEDIAEQYGMTVVDYMEDDDGE